MWSAGQIEILALYLACIIHRLDKYEAINIGDQTIFPVQQSE